MDEDKLPLDTEKNILAIIVQQNDVLIKYVADIRNILVMMANKQGIKVNQPEQTASVYHPMDTYNA